MWGVGPRRRGARHHDRRQGHRRRLPPERGDLHRRPSRPQALVESERQLVELRRQSPGRGGRARRARDHPRTRISSRTPSAWARRCSARLEALKERYACVGEVRGKGLLLGRRAGAGPQDQGARGRRRSPRRSTRSACAAAWSPCPTPRRSASIRPSSSPRSRPWRGSPSSTRRWSVVARASTGSLAGADAARGASSASATSPCTVTCPAGSARPDVEHRGGGRHRPGAARRGRATLLPGARWYDSAETLLDREALDFVDICTPPSSHAALDRGRAGAGAARALREAAGPVARRSCAARRAGRGARPASSTPCTTGITRPSCARTRADRRGRGGRRHHVAWHTLRTGRPPAATSAAATGASIPPSRAAACSPTTAGTCSTSSSGGSARPPVAVSAALETRRHHRQFAVEDTASVSSRSRRPRPTSSYLGRRRAPELGRGERHRAACSALDDDTLVLDARRGRASAGSARPRSSDGSQHPDWFDAVAERVPGRRAGAGPSGDNLAEASALRRAGGAGARVEPPGRRPAAAAAGRGRGDRIAPRAPVPGDAPCTTTRPPVSPCLRPPRPCSSCRQERPGATGPPGPAR